MLQADMEQALENLDRRLARVEQILPTLATKDDLERVRRRSDVMFESLKSDIGIVADGLATQSGQISSLTQQVSALTQQVSAVTQQVAAVTQQVAAVGDHVAVLSHRVDGVTEQVGGVTKRLDHLTQRLELKGVI